MSSPTNVGSIVTRFNQRKSEKTIEVEEEFNKIKGNRALIKIFKKKYPNLKRQSKNKLNKKTKKLLFYPLIKEWFEILKNEFDDEQQEIIYKYVITKIAGIFKHAQALKTGLCNQKIIYNIKNEPNTLTFCITKNTIEANEQWWRRLISKIEEAFPDKHLQDLIMIISSRPVKVENITHCKNMDEAWSRLSVKNEFKAIFCCSNSTRINDIIELTTKFINLVEHMRKNIKIIHDEAHNSKEGLPPNRDVIENILSTENVKEYCPVTASAFVKEKGLSDEENPCWYLENLKMNGFNYTGFDEIKSDSPNYSSCKNAEQYTCEQLKKNPLWKRKNIPERVDEELYERVHEGDIPKFQTWSVAKLEKEFLKYFDPTSYKNGNYKWIEDLHRWEDVHAKIKNGVSGQKNILAHVLRTLYINRKREFEFCSFMKQDQEKEAIENGINFINMNNLLGKDFYQPKKFNLHLLNTPNRKIITRYLAEEASKMFHTKTFRGIKRKLKINLNPIVLAIYGNEGNKYHLLYDQKEEVVDHVMTNGEFNTKLSKLLKYLNQKGINTQRPFIIIGNYNPTGESISFAHTDYGAPRAVMACTSGKVFSDYQIACRGNLVNTHFKKKDPSWTFSEKYLIGPENFIKNVNEGEQQNDDYVDYLIASSDGESTNQEIQLKMAYKRSEEQLGTGTVATPIKIEIDPDSPGYSELEEIMRKNRKNEEDYSNFMRILKEMVDDDDDDTEIIDKTSKFNWETQKLKQFRCYKTGHKEESYRFDKYDNHHVGNAPYINNKNKILREQCEILTCLNRYVLKDKTGKQLYRNKKRTWYIGYKY